MTSTQDDPTTPLAAFREKLGEYFADMSVTLGFDPPQCVCPATVRKASNAIYVTLNNDRKFFACVSSDEATPFAFCFEDARINSRVLRVLTVHSEPSEAFLPGLWALYAAWVLHRTDEAEIRRMAESAGIREKK